MLLSADTMNEEIENVVFHSEDEIMRFFIKKMLKWSQLMLVRKLVCKSATTSWCVDVDPVQIVPYAFHGEWDISRRNVGFVVTK